MAGRTTYGQPSGRLRSHWSSVKRTGSFFSHFFCFWARSLMLDLLSWAVGGRGGRSRNGRSSRGRLSKLPMLDDTHEPELTQTCKVQTHSLGRRMRGNDDECRKIMICTSCFTMLCLVQVEERREHLAVLSALERVRVDDTADILELIVGEGDVGRGKVLVQVLDVLGLQRREGEARSAKDDEEKRD